MRKLLTSAILIIQLVSQSFYINANTSDISISQKELVYLETTKGLVVLQLLPQVAPNHVTQFTLLVKSKWYDGLDFYRVIDGFVAQAGEGEGEWNNVKGKPSLYKKPIKAEFSQPANETFQMVEPNAFLAPQTGYIDSVPAGRDVESKEQWLLHCPGTVAMARDNAPNTASSEFYIVIGQAPRHLDRNMSIFARVVQGMDVVQRIERGPKSEGGIIPDDSTKTRIISAKIGTEIAHNRRLNVFVQSVDSEAFQQRLLSVRKRQHEFYVHPGTGKIDVCYYQPEINIK